MQLFIDRLPFVNRSISLQVIVTEPGLSAPPANAVSLPWILDTGMSGDAFCWRMHLEKSGLDPDRGRYHRHARVRASAHFEKPLELPIRKADLWLASHLGDEQQEPYCLALDEGIVFRDDTPPAQATSTPRALIGMRALM